MLNEQKISSTVLTGSTPICINLSKIETKNFPEDTVHDLEKWLSVEELSVALKQMKKNKSPGIDGLTVEFYLTFWDILKNYFCKVLKECIRHKSLSKTMNTALVRLFYKN